MRRKERWGKQGGKMGYGEGTRPGLGINAFLHQLNPNEYTKINTTQFFSI